MQQQVSTTQPNAPFTPINPDTLIREGDSPTAIILAIAILLSVVLGSVSLLIRVAKS